MPAVVFEYATVRVVPQVERDEFINAGVLVYCATEAFLGCRVRLNRERLVALCPKADAEVIARHLEAFAAVAQGRLKAGPVAALPLRERFHWLVAPRSAVLQVSPVHSGIGDDLDAEVTQLFEHYVR